MHGAGVKGTVGASVGSAVGVIVERPEKWATKPVPCCELSEVSLTYIMPDSAVTEAGTKAPKKIPRTRPEEFVPSKTSK